MNKIAYHIIFLLILTFLFSSCSRKTAHSSFAFYNVENLFDTIDDLRTRDNSHLPDSKIPWNTERYKQKLDNLVSVMSAVDSGSYPTLFGLCEVENIDVLKDLINHPGLKKAGYSILHKDSPDERGIDNALLYQSEFYQPIETQYLSIVFPWNPTNSTRDILYSKGVIHDRDTVHVFINHWVSRWGGREKTEPSRRFIGEFLKAVTDSIFEIQPQANIIIAGDLNDNPDDLSILTDLGAKLPEEPYSDQTLYNLSLRKYREGTGTLYYRSWDMFDQIIVSTAMLNSKKGIRVDSIDQTIIMHDWMLYQTKNGDARPNRTAAREYYGGYSDHLPVFIGMTSN